MRTWVVASASVAPIALIGGWTLAATRQPPGYDPVRDTISALAARDATDAWIMTVALAVLGLCHLVTAAGLTDVGPAARVALGLGGLATLAVAASPQPSAAHVPAAAVGFAALTLWPALWRWPTRPVGLVVAGALAVLLVWFGLALHAEAAVGLAERMLAGAQALVPLGVAVAWLATRRRAAPAG